MVKKITSALFLAIVIAVALFLATKNSTSVTLYLSSTWQVTASLGVIAMGCFGFGIIVASIVASYFGVRAFIREKQLIWKDKRSREFWKQISRARGYLATGDFKRAHSMWNDLITSDPTNTIARAELAKVLLTENKPVEALKLLDEARAEDKQSLEVLMLAYEVNIKLGNRTAALDNLNLIIQNHPTVIAVQLARNLAEELRRPEEALRYHEMLYALGSKTDDYDIVKARLEFERLKTSLKNHDLESNKAILKKFIKNHKSFPDAYLALAEIEENSGNVNSACQYLVEAAKVSHNSDYWYQAAKLWLKHSMPDAAISAAKSAVREATAANLIRLELDLVRLYIATNHLDEAEKHLNEITQFASTNNVSLTDDESQTVLVLMGLCLNRRGKHKESADIWRKLSKYDYSIPEIGSDFRPFQNNSAPPSPVLSTP